jgi:hypothetical protein
LHMVDIYFGRRMRRGRLGFPVAYGTDRNSLHSATRTDCGASPRTLAGNEGPLAAVAGAPPSSCPCNSSTSAWRGDWSHPGRHLQAGGGPSPSNLPVVSLSLGTEVRPTASLAQHGPARWRPRRYAGPARSMVLVGCDEDDPRTS